MSIALAVLDIIRRVKNPFHIKPLQVWIACFAILLNALAPSISHALDAFEGRTASWVEICSVDGARLIAVAADGTPAADDPSSSPQAQASPHCPFCASHAGSAGLPPPAAAASLPTSGSALLPLLFYQAPSPLFAWSAAHPRGPPATL